MRILYHHRTRGTGVEGVHISGVIDGLKCLGHRVTEVALVSAARESSQREVVREPRAIRKLLFSIAKHAPNKLFRMAELVYGCTAFWKIATALRREKHDLLYERYAYFNFGGALASKLFRIPMILEVNIVTTLNDVRRLELRAIARYIEEKLLRSADAIFVVSDFLKDHLMSRGVDGDKIHVQPNAFSATGAPAAGDRDVDETLETLMSRRVVIGFLGRLVPWYRLDCLLKVFHSIHRRYPNTCLVLVGDGTERRRLETLADELMIRDSVHFCGEVSHEHALGLLEAFDVGVIPSTNPWGSPMKLFEYMGMGVPVVAPGLDVITSVMRDGAHGRIFPLGDFAAMEQALEGLILDPELRRKMGQRARAHVLANHTWDRVAQNIMIVARENLMNGRDVRSLADRAPERVEPAEPAAERMGVVVPLR
jgi:glycosyltransferase involved in cell wall biosynthesis